MLRVMAETFPESVTYTRPHGGMFVWITLPEGCSSQDVFEAALKEHVAVLPGTPFYVDGGGTNTMRLNFSNSYRSKDNYGNRTTCTGNQELVRELIFFPVIPCDFFRYKNRIHKSQMYICSTRKGICRLYKTYNP